MTAPIKVAVALTFADDDRVVRAKLGYDAADPFACTLTFPTVDPDTDGAEWVFARDLLREGLSRCAGIGDVRVWPHAGDRYTLNLLLTGEGNEKALFRLPRRDVAWFVKLSYSAVPRGQEHVDWDAVSRRLLGGVR